MKALNMTLQKHNDYGKMALDTIFDKLRENRGEKEEEKKSNIIDMKS